MRCGVACCSLLGLPVGLICGFPFRLLCGFALCAFRGRTRRAFLCLLLCQRVRAQLCGLCRIALRLICGVTAQFFGGVLFCFQFCCSRFFRFRNRFRPLSL